MKNKLFKVEDCNNLDITQVHTLYRNHVNSSRVDLLSSFGFGRELIKDAKGAYIYTKSGKKIVDFTGGIGVLNHGHNHPRILKVRKDFQNENRMEVHRNYFSQYIAALSHNVSNLLPDDLNYSFFVNSGSESVEWALKTAFKYHNGKRNTVLYSDIAFHGKLFGSESVTNSPENFFNYPRIPNTYQYKFNNIESVKNLVRKFKREKNQTNIAAIIIEPFNVSNLIGCNQNFIRDLRNICNQEDIILIFDEVYSGWCKTGPLFYFMKFENIIPDILCTAKSLGGGKASISGLVTRKKIFKQAFDSPSSANLQTTTYYGFGEETITAIEAINIIIEDEYQDKSFMIEKMLKNSLSNLKIKYPKIIKEVRGSGALFGIFFNETPKLLNKIINFIPSDLFQDKRFLDKLIIGSIVSDLYESHNILTFTSLGKDLHLIISPPLIISKEEIDNLIKALDITLTKGLYSLVSKFVKNKLSKIKI